MALSLKGIALGLVCLALPGVAQQTPVIISNTEIAALKSLGPWPIPAQKDPSNALSGNSQAIHLGRRLFTDVRLSPDGTQSCLNCHRPPLGFSDGLALSKGRELLTRNSQGLWNLAGQFWFGWDGASDSLWLHSIRPMMDSREIAATPAHIAQLLQSDPILFGLLSSLPAHNQRAPANDDAQTMVTAAKSLAAFMETFRSPRTSFDRFRDAALQADEAGIAQYPAAAQRGFKLFVGSANCISCHAGPAFTNGEFADNGVGHFLRLEGRKGEVDSGRHGGLQKLFSSRYNLLGEYSDAPTTTATHSHFVISDHSKFGQFKVPSLRELTRSAPYMHDGRLNTLEAVVQHYSSVSEERLHSNGEKSLRPLNLSADQIADLVAFLQTLSFSPERR